MQVQYIGQSGDPDTIKQYGFTFERKGAAVTVPDNSPYAAKFVNNPFFKVTGNGVATLKATPVIAPENDIIIDPTIKALD
ncbi:MAG: hypothetical protein KGL20_05160 [Rhodospirillales bacterium]|nr:hypothetical protein [Rhodospirillales bacterium]